MSVTGALNQLRNRLTGYFKILRDGLVRSGADKQQQEEATRSHRLTVVVDGWNRADARAIHATVSNCVDDQGQRASHAFSKFYVKPELGRRRLFRPFGATAGSQSWELASDRLLSELEAHASRDDGPPAVMDYLVDLIREEADSPRAGRLIGKSCMATAIRLKREGADQLAPLARYYPADQSAPNGYAPHLIMSQRGAGIAVAGIQVHGGPVDEGWSVSFDDTATRRGAQIEIRARRPPK